MAATSETTQILQAMAAGDATRRDRLLEMVYPEMRRLAQGSLRSEAAGHSLQATDIVHEVFLRLADQKEVDWKGRSHFFAVAAQAMRRILVDHARGKRRLKRGGDLRRVAWKESLTVSPQCEDDVLAVDEALEKLAQFDPQKARLVELRFFGGMTVDEAAAAMGLAKRTAEREWTGARAWLRRELADANQL